MSKNDKKQKEPGAIFQILNYAGSHKPLFYLGCALAGINAILSIVPLFCVWFIIKDLIEVYPNFNQASGALNWALLAVLSSVLSIIVYFIALMCTHKTAFRIAANMRRVLIDHISKVPLGYFINKSSGEMRRTIDNSTGATEDVIAHKVPDFVASMVTPLIFLVLMFVFDWIMGLLCLIPILVSFGAMWWMMGRKSAQGGKYFMQRYQQALMDMSNAATEYVRGIPVVKMFQQTSYSFKAFYNTVIEYRDMAFQYTEYCKKPQVFQLVAINSAFVVLVPAGLILAKYTQSFPLFITNFLFYVIISASITTMMTKVMYSTETIMIAEDAMRRVNGVLSVKQLDEAKDYEIAHPKNMDITLKNVHFTYPETEQEVLKGVSMQVPDGSAVALVGESGGGKSTLATLIPRFWDASSGEVEIGGVSVRNIPTEELMKHIAFVFQHDHLLKMSIKDNVKTARPEASDKEVLEALEAAQCQDIIDKFDHGINTVIGEKGVYLSGGERQRIVLARAILKDAPIIILDEATAFADPENEVLIQKALKRLCEGKTVLMIAHRLSTITNLDRIYVLNSGVIRESGTHIDLINEGGLYSQMWDDYQKGVSWKIEGGDSDVA